MKKLTLALAALAAASLFTACSPKAKSNTIVDVAAANGSFNTLVTAVKAAGLEETLKGKGPFTVFAPTDAAFAKLPANTVETLLKPENQTKLANILKYHVVSGKVPSSEVVKLNGKKVATVLGQEVAVTVEGTNVTLTDANGGTSKVTIVDVAADNGVIHVIDTVLMPAE